MTPIIDVSRLSYQYPRRKEKVLRDVNFQVNQGDFVAIMGRNGAGKTTLCQSLNGVIPHLQGGTIWGDVVLDGLNTQDVTVADLAQRIGMVLEDPEAQLFTTRVDDEMAFGVENLCLPRQEIVERINWAAKVVRLEDKMDKEPTMLSGGQKQRLAIAATLAMRPKIMVLDEPTSQLDPLGTDEVFSVILRLKKEMKMTVLVATHKSEHIAQYADKVLVLDAGQVVAYDTPQVIFRDERLMMDASIRPPQVALLASYLQRNGVVMPSQHFPIVLEEAEIMVRKVLGASRD